MRPLVGGIYQAPRRNNFFANLISLFFFLFELEMYLWPMPAFLIFLITAMSALAGVAQWTECQPANQKVASSIPSQGTWWVAGQVSGWWRVRGN